MVFFAFACLVLQERIFLLLRHILEIFLDRFFLLVTLIRGTHRHVADIIDLLDVFTQNTLKKASGVTTKQNVCTTTSHIRRDSYRAATSSLGDNLRFTLVILRVQHIMSDSFSIKQI